MSKRKVRPQPPRYAWFELDGCWFCKNRKGCGGCKVMKRYVADQKEKIKRDEKKKFDFS
jgi:hypothetical protein